MPVICVQTQACRTMLHNMHCVTSPKSKQFQGKICPRICKICTYVFLSAKKPPNWGRTLIHVTQCILCHINAHMSRNNKANRTHPPIAKLNISHKEILSLQRHFFAGTRIFTDFTDCADWFRTPHHPRNPRKSVFYSMKNLYQIKFDAVVLSE